MRTTLEETAKLLLQGAVVAVPTETVYGLAASIHHENAIDQIFALKNRPRVNPLIVHIADREQIDPFVEQYPPFFDEFAAHFWPGPLTLILPVKTGALHPTITAGLVTGAFRVPRHPLALQLLKLTGPLVMPSANLSGRPSSTRSEHVEVDFGNGFPVLEGGVSTEGLESTILAYLDAKWVILRQGRIPREAFEPLIGYVPDISLYKGGQPLSPGQLFRHYAPQARLSFDLTAKGATHVLGFVEREYPTHLTLLPLGSLTDPATVALSLYDTLRELDQRSVQQAVVDMDFPSLGLWATIRERLEKAAK